MIASTPGQGSLALRWLLFGVLAVGALSVQPSRGTLAYFTSAASSADNTFTAGTIVINVADANEGPAASVQASIGASNASFRPGQTVVGYVAVRNAGTLPFDYGLTYTATNGATSLIVGTPALNPTLEVLTANSAAECSVANVAGQRANLASRYGPRPLSTSPGTVVVDSGGSTKLSLDASSSQVVCLAVSWPNSATAGAENAQQGGSATLELAFDARQQ